MRFLSVAERELRSGARQKGTFRIRWISALVAFVLLVWLGWAFDVFQNRGAAPRVFHIFAVLIFLYCLFIGATGTADCISREKREGTLGLLFLTNLNSAEIVAGKICANGLSLIYSLLAFFPVLALPVLIGGITFGEFWRTVLALVSVLFFAMAAGFNASAVNVRQFSAIAQATGLALFFGMGLSAAAVLMRHFGFPAAMVETVAAFSPLHTLNTANAVGRFAAGMHYWISLGAVTLLTWFWFGLAAWRVRRSWRDQPKATAGLGRFNFSERFRQRGRTARAALRRRLLEINPFFWLAGRQRVSAPVFMLLTIVISLVTMWVAAPYFEKVLFRGSPEAPVGARLFVWGWAGFAIHALALYYGAFVASQRLAEDKQVGALELVLVTPTGERAIGRGLWLAYWRRMLFPVLIAVLVHCYFIWLLMTMVVIDPPGRLPFSVTAGQVFWAALLNQPLKGQFLEWIIPFMVRFALLALAAFAANWVMIGWVGRWLGLKMKHPGFTPMAVMSLAVAPPILLFSLLCYTAEKFRFFNMPERHWLPLMLWAAFAIVIGNCALLSTWAATRLRRDFRRAVTGRYDAPGLRDWLGLMRRVVIRFAIVATALVIAVTLVTFLFYAYQNWRGQQRWNQFQAQLKQRGESLDLAAVLRGPVPSAQNFAETTAFQNLLRHNPTNISLATLSFKFLTQAQFNAPFLPTNPQLAPWLQQDHANLHLQLRELFPKLSVKNSQGPKKAASAILEGLSPLQTNLNAVGLATQLPYFAPTTNRDSAAVLGNSKELRGLEQLHFVFQVRACAFLALGRTNDAAADVLTGLRLAQLAAQSSDLNGSLRVQAVLLRSLQPVWEGLAGHRWTESQLAAFQKQLTRFNLLADHTNAVHRVALAYIETWRSVPTSREKPRRIAKQAHPDLERVNRWQPRSWWYDNCIQLYQARENAIARVDVAAGRINDNMHWGELEGLPVSSDVNQLFEQNQWSGKNSTLVSFAQTAVNQGIIACALERHRLSRGSYPTNLDQLVPDYFSRIPRDINRGRPMFYHLHDNGVYELRGTGPNGTIEQGNAGADDYFWSFTAATNLPAIKPPARKIKR